MGDNGGTPTSFELHFDEAGNVVCDLGVIAYPWPEKVSGTADVANIGPLIVVDGVTVLGLEEWEWLYESGSFDLHLRTGEDDSRMFLEIHAGNGHWTYELFEAHWRDESPYAPIDAGVFLASGRIDSDWTCAGIAASGELPAVPTANDVTRPLRSATRSIDAHGPARRRLG